MYLICSIATLHRSITSTLHVFQVSRRRGLTTYISTQPNRGRCDWRSSQTFDRVARGTFARVGCLARSCTQEHFCISIQIVMRNFFRKLAVLILIAGLPLQNLHAFAMPLCDHDAQTTAASQPHSHDGEGAAQEHEHSTSSDVKLACDGCSMCQACSAPAVAGVAFEFSNDAGTSAPIAYSVSAISSLPEHHFRPPLAPVI